MANQSIIDISAAARLTPDEWQEHMQRGTWGDFRDGHVDKALAASRAAMADMRAVEAEFRAVAPQIRDLRSLSPYEQSIIRERIKGKATRSRETRGTVLGAVAQLVRTADTFQTASRHQDPVVKALGVRWQLAAEAQTIASFWLAEVMTHEGFVQRALDARHPVSAAAAAKYGLQVPAGYTGSGDLLIWDTGASESAQA